MKTITKIKTGIVLISEPSQIGDSSFQHSVVLVAEHSKNGSIGFVTNKPLTYTISDILPEVTDEYRIYNGGPLEQDSLYFIHSIPELIPNSTEIAEGVYWGGTFELIAELIKDKMVRPSDVKFFLGYSGWSYNQLCVELEENNWIVTSLDLRSLVADETNSCWEAKMIELRGDSNIWANAPENPNYN